MRRFTPITATAAVALAGVCAAGPARAAEPEKVRLAIQRGTEFLRNYVVRHPITPFEAIHTTVVRNPTKHAFNYGRLVLGGLALHEAGVPPDDPVLRDILTITRAGAIIENATYNLALAIMLLESVGDENDVPLIQLMGVRLLAGQNGSGGWGYDCIPYVHPAEARRLQAALLGHVQLGTRTLPALPQGNSTDLKTVRGANDRTDAARPEQPDPVRSPDSRLHNKADPEELPANRLHKAVVQHSRTLRGICTWPDNSNTQFAVMALWIAHRHGVPVTKTFQRVGHRFRTTQEPNAGGWPYRGPDFGEKSWQGPDGKPTGSMVCSGLLGLAVGHGLAAELREKGELDNDVDPARDESLRAGLVALRNHLARRLTRAPDRTVMLSEQDYYYFWSVERVAAALDLDKIRGIDWYEVGSNALVWRQLPDGSWRGTGLAEEDPAVATSFALLFLAKSNLVPDLTTTFEGVFRKRVEVRGGGLADLAEGDLALPDSVPPVPEKQKPDMPKAPKPNPAAPASSPQDYAAWSAGADLLAEGVVLAEGEAFTDRLERLREAKGSVNTEALARAIPRLDEPRRGQAREALARRLVRMNALTLQRMLKDANAEVRRGAAAACGLKGSRELAPDLVAALADAEPAVAAAARGSLRELTGQDFGPETGAGPAERAAAAAWQKWLQSQPDKP